MAEPVVLVTFDAYLDRWAAAHGGYDPRGSVWSRGWLRLTYAFGTPLARAGVPPWVLTLAGVLVAGLVPVAVVLVHPLLGVPLIALSALLDSVDGAVAVMTDRATAFGAVLDSAADRVSEGFLLLALWLTGADAWLCVLAGAAMWLHEYVRARALAVGLADIGIVTVSERPTRLLVLAAGLALWHAQIVTGILTGLALFGLVQLLVVVHRRLHPPR